jgi:polysaccharide deacetylase family protein (PEP-CTERM system associated)
MVHPQPESARQHLLTVVLEDYFQVAPFRDVIPRGQWYRFETRVERNTLKALDLLDEFGIRATFFALGWIADQMPEVIREVARRGHEVASKGYYHRSIRQMTPGEFRDDLRRARDAIERATGRRVLGYRIAHQWFTSPADLWALDVLAEEGFAYDSSLCPLLGSFAREPWRCVAHVHRHGGRELHEFPLPTLRIAGLAFPIGGGNYLRQFPDALMRRAVARWQRTHDSPFVFYFHVWELDPEQPRITAAPLRERIRQYRNLDKMPRVVRDYLSRHRFTGLADHLGIDPAPAIAPAPAVTPVAAVEVVPSELPGSPRQPVTIVVPCFNEEATLTYLAQTLRSVEATLGRDYELHFVFVDDGSGDGTWRRLEEIFGSRPSCALVRHARNAGVAAAILTGIREARTEIVCSIDSDCTYDPHQLAALIPLLRDGVDLVTASPYHRLGRVANVPGWRLMLSKGLSLLYRRILRQKLATYTSCFRVYRRSAVADLTLREGGFLGVAELIALLDLRGRRIVECPAVLEARLLGHSKMKVFRTIGGHLRLLGRLLAARRGLHSPLQGHCNYVPQPGEERP